MTSSDSPIKGRFPFGRPSTVRPPRKPTSSRCELFVLGVYPSALHIRWRLPEDVRRDLGLKRTAVGALAVDVEPEVFWDGNNSDLLVNEWKTAVAWDSQAWGFCQPAANGTSGKAVDENILQPLGVDATDTWFTDLIPWFFVKSSTSKDQQADVIRTVYEPFGHAMQLPQADLPARPSANDLVNLASETQRTRLVQEILESETKTLVTLGEETRQVVLRIADQTQGEPTIPLKRSDTYGGIGKVVIGERTIAWRALTHPGNRSPLWADARGEWTKRASQGL